MCDIEILNKTESFGNKYKFMTLMGKVISLARISQHELILLIKKLIGIWGSKLNLFSNVNFTALTSVVEKFLCTTAGSLSFIRFGGPVYSLSDFAFKIFVNQVCLM